MDRVQAIRDADRRIKSIQGGARRTPLEPANWLPEAEVWLKCEHLQRTGSFKFRGALNKLSRLDEDHAAAGVLAASTGNHGLGVATAARLLGIDAEIYVPETASPMKLEAIRAQGATVTTLSGDPLSTEVRARADAEAFGRPFISPYNDPDIVAGQGTIGLELAEQASLDAVFVSVGGGGLISGIGTFLRSVEPGIEIVGCWPENAPAMQRCLEAGEIIEVEETETLSDGTAGGVEPGAITFPMCQALIDRHVLVSEQAIRSAMRDLADRERWMVEGAAGVALAAFQSVAGDYAGKRVAVVLCGRNITREKFLSAVK